MIDRTSRDKLAEALRQYASGRITNYAFDDIDVDKRDLGAVEVKHAVWHLYDDLYEHKAVNNFYINKNARKEIARWIVFLQSDKEYIWPKMSVIDMLLSVLTFGFYGKLLQKQWGKMGDSDAWPFIDKNELNKVISKPKLLAGKVYNKSER